jgi:hypothetical protein
VGGYFQLIAIIIISKNHGQIKWHSYSGIRPIKNILKISGLKYFKTP